MTILPVLDLRHGLVVRGIAGNRAEYRPIRSQLADTPDPLVVARALSDAFGFREFYVADLDAILDSAPNFDIYSRLTAEGFRILVDAGVRGAGDAARVRDAGASAVVAGLETLDGPDVLRALRDKLGEDGLVFSLDMAGGRALGCTTRWAGDQPFQIAAQAIAAGVRRMIVLDLAAVGAHGGVTTLDLCRRIVSHDPAVRVITGGGVRGLEDLHPLAEAGIDQVLAASALHDGRLRPEELARFTRDPG